MSLDSVSPILFESVSNVTATNSVQLGQRACVGDIEYVYVYNGGSAQISQGQGGYFSPTNLSSAMTVAVSNAASQAGGERFVGVAHNATLPTGYYGWLATRGPVLVALDASEVSMNSGDILVPGVDGGFVVKVGTSTTGIPLGVAINSLVTTVGTGKARIKSPFMS